MRVFISSVRKGLEEERDALPGIVRAAGHIPVRFEDFSAQNEPSREACLKGMDNADAYLLVLGPRYGHVFPDTGQSPTHEEWTAATAAGLTRMVYRKSGVQFDPEQQELSRQISDYATGVFHDKFATTAELLTKVVAKLRELDESSGDLNYAPLQEAPPIEWRSEFDARYSQSSAGSQIEIHVAPQPPAAHPARVMNQLSDSLVGRLRTSGFVNGAVALDQTSDENSTSISVPSTQTRIWNESCRGELGGFRLSRTGQVSAWGTLPHNGMAYVLDPKNLQGQIADMLRLIGAMNLIRSERLTIGAAISPIRSLTIGTFREGQRQNEAIGLKMSDQPLRASPDESTSLAALSSGASEAAGHIVRVLVDRYRLLR